ncbi:DNA repair helicase [Nitrosopumilus sp. b1]|uniref:DNA repair helicase n=1 Tax=Nitrosopumilus sp. b1 TaxID=2109907 RepID=UPI0021082C61|nr:DNA repair helicase [Nitrosopumilus sp. b1]
MFIKRNHILVGVLGLRDIPLKEEYRSDRDDIIKEFFIPCLSNCIEYDRCIEYVSLKGLTTLSMGFDNFAKNKAKLRIVSGHRFNVSDLAIIKKIFSDPTSGLNLQAEDPKFRQVREMVKNHQVAVKIAIPNSDDVVGSFSERIGLFIDDKDDVVAFSGTSNRSFSLDNRNFESVDVFTSWNDKSRVDTKIKDFENLWENKTKYVEVYDFNYAEKNNLLKFSSDWVIERD